MTENELKITIKNLQKEGHSNDKIAQILLLNFLNGNCDIFFFKKAISLVNKELDPEIEKAIWNNPEKIFDIRENMAPEKKLNAYVQNEFNKSCKSFIDLSMSLLTKFEREILEYLYGMGELKEKHSFKEAVNHFNDKSNGKITARDITISLTKITNKLSSTYTQNDIFRQSKFLDMLDSMLYLYSNGEGFMPYENYLRLLHDETNANNSAVLFNLMNIKEGRVKCISGGKNFNTYFYNENIMSITGAKKLYFRITRKEIFPFSDDESDYDFLNRIIREINDIRDKNSK